jgi:protein CpxP
VALFRQNLSLPKSAKLICFREVTRGTIERVATIREQPMTRPFFHLLVAMFLGGLGLPGVATAPAHAQETAAPSAAAETPPAPVPDPVAGRIKYLHDRLRITPEQEPLWAEVAQAIRDNVRDVTPLLKERFRATTSGSALDVLHSYEMLGEVQLDRLKKFIAAFEPFYAGLSDLPMRFFAKARLTR